MENAEGAIKIGQCRETDNKVKQDKETKRKHHKICVRHHRSKNQVIIIEYI